MVVTSLNSEYRGEMVRLALQMLASVREALKSVIKWYMRKGRAFIL